MALSENLPRDASAAVVPLMPASAALEETYDATVSASTEITLNASTTIIRVVVGGEAVMMKWGTTDASTTDWDHVIPSGGVMDFVVPVESGTTLYTAVNFIERAATAWIAVGEF